MLYDHDGLIQSKKFELQRTSPFENHLNLLLVLAVYGLVVSLLLLRFEISTYQIFIVLAGSVAICLLSSFSLFGVLAVYAVIAGREKGETWTTRFENKIRLHISSGRLKDTLCSLFSVMLVMSFFDMAKSIMSFYIPFYADPTLAQIDRVLHGGVYPHDWILPFLKESNLTVFLNDAYMTWFIVLLVSISVACCCEYNRKRQMQFLWTFCLSWIICGTVLAWLFSSCGPIYYKMYYPDLHNPYENLMEWLRIANDGGPVQAIAGAAWLHALIDDQLIPDINGISSMPSLHVAIAWMIGLYTWSFNRLAGIVAFAFALLILVGSVALAWHYAIDGYLGIAVVSLIWWSIGRTFRDNKKYALGTPGNLQN